MDSLDLLLKMDISLEVSVPNKRALIALAADRLADKNDPHYDRIKSALLARERLGPTALGRGVVVPHAVLRDLAEPACAFIQLSSPMNFDAPDETAIDVVLALIWPETDIRGFHGFLCAVSRVLIDPGILQLIRKADTADVVRRSVHSGVQSEMRRLNPESVDGGATTSCSQRLCRLGRSDDLVFSPASQTQPST